MKRKSFYKSIKAHERLSKYHNDQYKLNHNGNHWIKSGYHNNVVRAMKDKKRKLNFDEKKSIYKNSEYYYFN